jgi:hypothetical protein
VPEHGNARGRSTAGAKEHVEADAILAHPRVLSIDETARLEVLEQTIETGIKTFIQVGLALAEIRDSRLYRLTHHTFETYCRDRWQFTRQRAYQLIGAAEVAGTLECKPGVDIPEKALRLLSPIPKEKRQEVYRRAVEIAGDRPVTSSDILAAKAGTATKARQRFIPADSLDQYIHETSVAVDHTDDEEPARRDSYLSSRKREDRSSRIVEVMVNTVESMADAAEDVDLADVDARYRQAWALELETAARVLVRFAERLRRFAVEPVAAAEALHHGRRVLEVDEHGPVVVAKAGA